MVDMSKCHDVICVNFFEKKDLFFGLSKKINYSLIRAPDFFKAYYLVFCF